MLGVFGLLLFTRIWHGSGLSFQLFQKMELTTVQSHEPPQYKPNSAFPVIVLLRIMGLLAPMQSTAEKPLPAIKHLWMVGLLDEHPIPVGCKGALPPRIIQPSIVALSLNSQITPNCPLPIIKQSSILALLWWQKIPLFSLLRIVHL